ncbi:MAG: hypothetical protein V5A62_02360 [Haloarculaceae archaeon]
MSQYADRIAELHRRSRRDERAFEPPAQPPAEAEALRYLREGFGEALAVYLDARTGGPPVRFETGEFDRLQGAMNTWLSLYARCHGVEIDAAFTVRTAAEVFVDTHDLKGTAAVLTHVPGRDVSERTAGSGSAEPEADPEPAPADG